MLPRKAPFGMHGRHQMDTTGVANVWRGALRGGAAAILQEARAQRLVAEALDAGICELGLEARP